MARNPLARRTQMFEVTIEAHEVRAGPKRMIGVPASTVNLGGRSAASAKLSAIRSAHRRAGVPPWKGGVASVRKDALAATCGSRQARGGTKNGKPET